MAAALADSGLEPGRLCLEITESAVIADPDAATEILEQLKALGVRLAIDDFGIGYSSLSQLKALLPVDTIKIDKSFVDGVTHARRGQRDRRRRPAARGRRCGSPPSPRASRRQEQVEALMDLGCSLSQGYHYARPQTPEDLQRMLAIEAHGRATV